MNSMFDNLKQTVDGNENITFDRNTDVFNFTELYLVEIKKRVNTQSVVKKGRNTRRNKETDSSYEEVKAKPKLKKVTKRTSKKNTEAKVPVVDLVGYKLDLVDEKMRDAVTEQLNTSIVIIEKHIDLESIEAGPALIKRPRMEEMFERVSNDTLVSKIAKKTPVVKHASESNDTMLSNTTKELTYESASNDVISSNRRTTKRAKKTEVQIHDDQSNTLSTKKKVNKRANKKTEILQIKKEKGSAKKDKAINDKDDQRERSIASDGINAHGDLEESPPNPETIKELQPRELQDLDQSKRDYFNRLTREIHNTTKNDAAEEKLNDYKNKSDILAPIVLVKRLSFEDLSNWMPSRRTSDTDSLQTTKVSQKTKSPVVVITRMSLEEFDKWLLGFKPEKNTALQKPSDLKLVYRTRSKSKAETSLKLKQAQNRISSFK